MKKFGSKSGFTLVELIVVIAILGILAGIAVPAYSGYIKKANEAADYAQLDAIKTAVVFAYTDAHVKDTTFNDIKSITVEKAASGTGLTVTVDPTTTGGLDISPYYDLTKYTFKSNTSKAIWYATEETGTSGHPAGWVLTSEAKPAG